MLAAAALGEGTPVGITGVPDAGTSFRVLQAGVDQVELRLDLDGQSVHKLGLLDHRPAGYGRTQVGVVGSFGKFDKFMDRVCLYREESRRLWVTDHPHEAGRLLPVDLLYGSSLDLLQRLAVAGISPTHEPVRVTRLDVTVDVLTSSPELGRALMSSLAAARVSAGRRVHVPYADLHQVELRPKGKGPKLLIAYDKGLERGFEKLGRNRWLRIEARKFWKGSDAPELVQLDGPYCRKVFADRVAGIAGGRVVNGGAAMTVTELLREGEIAPLEAERLIAFLEFERLGVADEVYPPRLLRDRRSLARKYGIEVPGVDEDDGREREGVSLDLQALLGEWSASL